jgi:hypothetical protein
VFSQGAREAVARVPSADPAVVRGGGPAGGRVLPAGDRLPAVGGRAGLGQAARGRLAPRVAGANGFTCSTTGSIFTTNGSICSMNGPICSTNGSIARLLWAVGQAWARQPGDAMLLEWQVRMALHAL